MKIENRFDKNYDYSGKWCLYKKTYTSPISSIFVIENKGGFIRYICEENSDKIEYKDEDYFSECIMFTLSPFETCKTPSIYQKKYDITNTSSKVIDGKILYCKYGYYFDNHTQCKNYKNGYCRCSILTSAPPQYEACCFELDIPIYKNCGEVDTIS